MTPWWVRHGRHASVVSEQDPSWTSVALEEYRSLRQESLQAIDRQHQILSLGAATSGVLLGIGVKERPGSTGAVVLLMVLMPLLAALVLRLWMGEFGRMVRAGAFVAQLEHKIGSRYKYDEAPLSWESELRKGASHRQRLRVLYRAIFLILLVLGAAAAGIGCVGLTDRDRLVAAVILGVADVLLLASVARFYVESELVARAIGGERFDARTVGWLARTLRVTTAALSISEKADP